jgi:Mn-dependent DtxR family transcriptional regulator
MAVAGEMIEQVQAPAGWLIEDFGDKKLVLSDLTVLDEVLILIHSGYPNAVSRELLAASLQRRDASSIRKAIKRLWEDKQIEYMTSTTIGLTKKGFGKASELLRQAANVAA